MSKNFASLFYTHHPALQPGSQFVLPLEDHSTFSVHSPYHTETPSQTAAGVLHDLANAFTVFLCQIEDALPFLPPCNRFTLLQNSRMILDLLHHAKSFTSDPLSSPHNLPNMQTLQSVLDRTEALVQPLAQQQHIHLIIDTVIPQIYIGKIACGVIQNAVMNSFINAIEYWKTYRAANQSYDNYPIACTARQQNHSIQLEITNPILQTSKYCPIQKLHNCTRHRIGISHTQSQLQKYCRGSIRVTKNKSSWSTHIMIPLPLEPLQNNQ